jgi:FHA domain
MVVHMSQRLGPALVVEHLLQASRAEVMSFGPLVLLVRTPDDGEPDFGAALEQSILKANASPHRPTSPGLVTAEIPTVAAPPDDDSDVDQAEMLAELSAAEHWVVPLQAIGFGLEPDARITVGRAADSRIHLTDRSVSAHHAEFTLADGGLRLADVGSKNGTAHNGVELRRDEKVWLQPMDRIRFGRVECFVCDPRALRAVLRTDVRVFR